MPAKAACQPTCFSLNASDQTVGAGLPAKAACQPTCFSLNAPDQTVGAGLPAKAASQSTTLCLTHHLRNQPLALVTPAQACPIRGSPPVRPA
ncbi:hypothetical protein EVS84_08260 [Pseudomonas koreensis]|uniref:Uncharacterized protein n=1 Tax=Pseudomonas koreensis TaxID=198620 RepID=A0A4V1WHV1_9PSED|nr:hypothetical protein EVS84_08260 [Pseudomonas koreensis]